MAEVGVDILGGPGACPGLEGGLDGVAGGGRGQVSRAWRRCGRDGAGLAASGAVVAGAGSVAGGGHGRRHDGERGEKHFILSLTS